MVIFHGFLLVYWRINQGMRRSRKMRATMSPSSISRPSLSSHMGNKNRRFQGSIHLAGYFEEGAHSHTETHTIHTYHIYIYINLILDYIILYYIVLYYIVLYYIVLYYVILYYITYITLYH